MTDLVLFSDRRGFVVGGEFAGRPVAEAARVLGEDGLTLTAVFGTDSATEWWFSARSSAGAPVRRAPRVTASA